MHRRPARWQAVRARAPRTSRGVVVWKACAVPVRARTPCMHEQHGRGPHPPPLTISLCVFTVDTCFLCIGWARRCRLFSGRFLLNSSAPRHGGRATPPLWQQGPDMCSGHAHLAEDVWSIMSWLWFHFVTLVSPGRQAAEGEAGRIGAGALRARVDAGQVRRRPHAGAPRHARPGRCRTPAGTLPLPLAAQCVLFLWTSCYCFSGRWPNPRWVMRQCAAYRAAYVLPGILT